MKSGLNKKMAFTFVLFTASFLLNLAWETFHSLMYNVDKVPVKSYLLILGMASLTDALLILVMYAAAGILCRRLSWCAENKKEAVIFITLTVLTAAFIEYRAVFIDGRWSYTAAMPTVFGLGLTPLIQLAITGFIAIWTTEKLADAKKGEKRYA